MILRRFIPLMTLAFWTLGTAAFGTLFAMGLVVAYSDPVYIPWALVGGALGALIMAFCSLGWAKVPMGSCAFRTLALVALAALLIIRLFFPFFPGHASVALLGLMEGFGALVIGRLRGVLEDSITEQERGQVLTPLRLCAIGGSLVGSGVGLWSTFAFTERGFFWVLGLSLVVSGCLSLWCMFSHRRAAPTLSSLGGLKREWPAWARLSEASAFLKWLLIAMSLAFVARYALVAETLTAYSAYLAGPLPSLLLFFSLLFIGSGLVLVLFYLLFSPLRRRIGAIFANCTYPVLALACLIVWLALPKGLIGPLLASVSYLALLPALFLPEVQSNISLLPGRFAKSLGHLLFGITPAGGMLVGGILWIFGNALLNVEGRLTLLFFLTLGLIGSAVALGLFYRRAYLRSLPTSPLQVRSLAEVDLPHFSTKEILELFKSSDPLVQELALRCAYRSKNSAFVGQVERLFAAASTHRVRMAAYAYLAKTPGSISPLLKSKDERTVTRTASAAVLYRLEVDHEAINALLGDERSGVRVMGCALAWQRGLADAATKVWEGIDLPAVRDGILIELIEVTEKTAPDPLVRCVKKLAWYPSPSVRMAAVQKLGDLLTGGDKDPDLLEVALAGLASEDPRVREKALPLLVASGADNAAVHIVSHLSDPNPSVRYAASKTLAATGDVEMATTQLISKDPEVVESAIRALAWSGKKGEEALLPFLAGLPPKIPLFRRLPKTAPVNVALENAKRRAVAWTALALETLEKREAARALRTQIPSKGSVDHLYRLIPKAYLDPIASLLRLSERAKRSDKAVQEDLETLAKSEDPYLKTGALLASNPETEDVKMNRLLFLKGLPYFQDLLLEELSLLDSQLEQVEYLKGETIFEEGSVGDRFYLIYQGSITLTHASSVLAELKVGEGFGEMALFEEEERSATARASSDTVLLSLEKGHFYTLIDQRPAILLQMTRQLSQRLREMDKRFALIST